MAKLEEITEKHFHQLSGTPKASMLKGYAYADKFDAEIHSWTRY